ncbi:polysaccharide deacetylase family protein [Paenibacillus macerans]|uniref:polysaccharide deacetylase family protein n=1 Tax=Paenibacillus macerans TaxID=44252 RepID=UPI003D316A67
MTPLLHKKLLLTAAACLILSSCGQSDSTSDPANANPTAPNQTEANINVDDSGEASQGNAGTGANTTGSNAQQAPGNAATSGSTTLTGEDLPAPEPEPQLLYHINKAYNVVPNDEAADKKVVLLTFDDGPKEKKMIDGLIDTLDKHEAKAIFFVNGYRVKEHPELLQLIADRGQILGNHSWDHIDLKKESAESMRKQIEDVQAIVKETTGEAPRFFRPPFGSGNDTTHQIADENGLIYMTWSNGSLDWDSKNKNKPEAVIANVLEQLHAGSNILMHELPWTVEALDELLTKLEEKGYGFVDPRSIGPAPAVAGNGTSK